MTTSSNNIHIIGCIGKLSLIVLLIAIANLSESAKEEKKEKDNRHYMRAMPICLINSDAPYGEQRRDDVV